MFLIDLDDNLAQKQCSIIASKDLPSSYLPADNSFYKAEKYTELAEEYKQKLIHAEETEANVLSFLLNEITQIKQEQKRENELISQILKVISH